MSRRPSGRHAALVARVELRRSWRNLTDTRRGMVMLAAGAVVPPLYGLGLGAGAYFLGGALANGSFSLARPIIGAALTALTGLVLAVTVQRAIKHTGEPDAADGLLTTAPYRDVLAGLLLAEFGRVGAAGSFRSSESSWDSASAPSRHWPVRSCLHSSSCWRSPGCSRVRARPRRQVRRRPIRVRLAPPGRNRTRALGGCPGAVHLAERRAGGPVRRVPGRRSDAVRVVRRRDVPRRPGDSGATPFAAGAVASLLVGVPMLVVAVDALAERVWYLDRVQPDHAFDPGRRRCPTGSSPVASLARRASSHRRAGARAAAPLHRPVRYLPVLPARPPGAGGHHRADRPAVAPRPGRAGERNRGWCGVLAQSARRRGRGVARDADVDGLRNAVRRWPDPRRRASGRDSGRRALLPAGHRRRAERPGHRRRRARRNHRRGRCTGRRRWRRRRLPAVRDDHGPESRGSRPQHLGLRRLRHVAGGRRRPGAGHATSGARLTRRIEASRTATASSPRSVSSRRRYCSRALRWCGAAATLHGLSGRTDWTETAGCTISKYSPPGAASICTNGQPTVRAE